MAFTPVPDCAFVRIQFEVITVPAVTWTNGLWFAQPGFGSVQLNSLVDHLQENFAVALMASLSDGVQINNIFAYDMESADGYIAVNGTNIPGTVIGSVASLQACLVVSFNGNQRGPWNRGRNSISGFDEDDVSSYTISQGAITDIVAAYQTLIDTPPAGWDWVVVSRYLDGVKRAAGVYAPVNRVRSRTDVQGRMQGRVDRP